MPSNASAQLHAIAAALRARGEKGMKRELTTGLRAGAQPLVSAVKTAAWHKLPHEGGLAARVANERVTVSVTTGARTAGVRMRTATHDSRATNAGYVRHPVYGRWIEGLPSQEIPQAAGWWTDTLRARSPAVTPVLLAVMEKIAAEIQAAGRI